MPAGKRQQTDVMLYTLIVFVGLFIATTAVAVIYYVKFEDQRTIANESKSKLEEVLNPVEQQKGLGKIVGTIPAGKSAIGTMVGHLDAAVSLIVGGPLEDVSAEVKVNTANTNVNDTLELLTQDYGDIGPIDPNTTGLIHIIRKLKTKLDDTTNAVAVLKQQFNDLQGRFDDAIKATQDKEQTLLAEKEQYQQQVNQIKRDYEALKALMKQTTDEQIQALMAQRDEERDRYNEEHSERLRTEAQLKMTQERLELALDELRNIAPLPDSETAAYKIDGKIILVDNQAKIVYLNIGSDDHVYPGLTFAVYDKGVPIPRNGNGKAEIEVFNVEKNISVARIIRSEIKRPLVPDDIIANLIWDSEKTNLFVVAGEFDLDSDGYVDPGAVDKIKALIEKWGGKVADTVVIDTDFVVLGRAPQVLRRPTFGEIETDPLAMEKYEASLQKLARYQQLQSQAQALSIPILNYERFLYFIGYKTQAGRVEAF